LDHYEFTHISYAELTNVIIAAFCPVIANMKNLTSSKKWNRMPAVYRELGSQAAKVGQKPTQFMAAVLTRAAGN
jgi:hypothetical protein